MVKTISQTIFTNTPRENLNKMNHMSLKKALSVFIFSLVQLMAQSHEAPEILARCSSVEKEFYSIADNPDSTETLKKIYEKEINDSLANNESLIVWILQSAIAGLEYKRRIQFNLLTSHWCKSRLETEEKLDSYERDLLFKVLAFNLRTRNTELSDVANNYLMKKINFQFPLKLSNHAIGNREPTLEELNGIQGVCMALSLATSNQSRLEDYINKYKTSTDDNFKLLFLWGLGFTNNYVTLNFINNLDTSKLDDRGLLIRQVALKRIGMKINYYHKNFLSDHIKEDEITEDFPLISSNETYLINLKKHLANEFSKNDELLQNAITLRVDPISNIYPIW